MSKRRNSNNKLYLVFLVIALLFYIVYYGTSFGKYLNSNTSDNISNVNTTSSISSEDITSTTSLVNENTTGNIRVHYIDVGQADSEFIELPNDESILIDAGETEDGELVTNYIKSLGYTKINYVIGTHPHEDHIGGMSYVLNNFDFDNIYMPNATTTTKTFENLLDTIASKNKTITEGKAGVYLINQSDLKAYMVAPVSSSYSDLNSYSIVLKITYKNKSFLFMGDATKLSENEITDDVSSDVIKVGHHGSSTASGPSFVVKVKPSIAIISVGKDNKYNLPSSDVIKRWEKVGAKVYRTDENGTIIVTSDGNSLDVSTEK